MFIIYITSFPDQTNGSSEKYFTVDVLEFGTAVGEIISDIP